MNKIWYVVIKGETNNTIIIIIIICMHLSIDLHMQPSPQKKGGARVTSMLCMTDNKSGFIPYSLQKGLQLKCVENKATTTNKRYESLS